MITSMADVFQLVLQRGHIDVGFLGAAQVDRRGNINTTVVGSYDAPRVRLPGSGGAAEIAAHAKRVIVVTSLDRRAFPERVDFITSPGRRVARVITDRCIFDRDADRDELVLAALYPGVTTDDIQDSVGWALRVSEAVTEVSMPSPQMLHVLNSLATA